MKIETDRVQVKSGLRHGRTIGSPLTLEIANLDFANWAADRMAVWAPETEVEPITLPRPGHADLAGMLKYGTDDLRPILERASARETAARVAAGGVAKALLRRYGMEIRSHVVRIGAEAVPLRDDLALADFEGVDESPVRCARPRGLGADARGHQGRRPGPRHPGRRLRGVGLRRPARARLARERRRPPRRPPRPGDHGHPGDQGRRDRRRLRAGAHPRQRGPRRDLPRPRHAATSAAPTAPAASRAA